MKRLLTILIFLTISPFLPMAVQAETLRLALDTTPPCLDYMSQLSGNLMSYAEWTFDPLVRWTRDMTIEARLAESWEQKDPRTLRVHLRKHVLFHSGNPMTAADVKWTFDRIRNAPEWKDLFKVFEGCIVVNDATVDFVFNRTEPLALNLMTYIFPMDSKFYSGQDAQGKDKDRISRTEPVFANTNVSGTGPFIMRSWEPQVKMVLDRNPDYWDKQSKGNVTRIILTPIKDPAARTAALISGDVDLINPVNPQDQDRISREPGLSLVNLPSSRVIIVGFNPNTRPEFKDPRVRQAVIAAVNNAGIVEKIMNKLTVPANQFSAKGMSGYNPELKNRFDLEKAKKLMKDAGFEKGFSATMIAPNNRYTNSEKVSEAIVSMLARINISVDLKTMSVDQYWPAFRTRQADLQMVGWHSDTEDSANLFEYLTFCVDNAKGYGTYNPGYCNPRLDELVRSATSEQDTRKRSRMLQDAEKMAYDDGASIPLHYEPLSWAAKKHIKLDTCINLQNYLYLGDLIIE